MPFISALPCSGLSCAATRSSDKIQGAHVYGNVHVGHPRLVASLTSARLRRSALISPTVELACKHADKATGHSLGDASKVKMEGSKCGKVVLIHVLPACSTNVHNRAQPAMPAAQPRATWVAMLQVPACRRCPSPNSQVSTIQPIPNLNRAPPGWPCWWWPACRRCCSPRPATQSRSRSAWRRPR